MNKYITRTTGGWTYTLNVEVDPYSGERYVDITGIADGVICHAHAYLTEVETKELIEALGGYYNV